MISNERQGLNVTFLPNLVGLHLIHVYLIARHPPYTVNSTLRHNFDINTIKLFFSVLS